MSNIKHINDMTNLPCTGIMIPAGVSIHGQVYKCSLCGKKFTVDSFGDVIL